MLLDQLEINIENKQAIIGVIGLGYVGLPVAASFAQVGFRVIGVDIKPDRVALINAGQCPIEGEEPGLAELVAGVVNDGFLHAGTSYSEIAEADVILIDVETPVDDAKRPKYVALRAACNELGLNMKQGTLVIVESTIAPGTIDNIVRPILEENSGGIAGSDFFLGACPERVMPGKLLKNLRMMSRVCGGTTPETANLMVKLYRQIVEADLDEADAVTAELVKTTENAYRDVQIAFANEVALICEAVGGDVWRVRDLVNKVPSRQMHLPGAGVGGHCIPKDPWLLAYGAGDKVPVRLIPQARTINDNMPLHLAEMAQQTLIAHGVNLPEARILVLGYAYLEESDDIRNSPSTILVNHLSQKVDQVIVHDPWVYGLQGDVTEMSSGCDAVILMVGHRLYSQLDLNAISTVMRTPIFIDGRHVIEEADAKAAGLAYRCIGKG